MNDVPPPSLIGEANISPNPVPAATASTKRVEFNFVPSMMMFENDDAHTTGTTGTTGTAPVVGSSKLSGDAVLPVWDTETDHMLSYFLSGNDQGPTAATDFTTTPSSSSSGPHSTTTDQNSSRHTYSTENNHHHHMQPPPTPAVHFYSNSTPLSSNVYRSGSTPADSTEMPKNRNAGDQHVYPPTLSTNMTGSTATTQSQSSSSSSLSSLATNVQLYHQQLQMQRMMAGSGGGHTVASNMSSHIPPISQHHHHQQQQPSPNTLLYPQMLLYPPPVPSNGGGRCDQQQIPQQSMNPFDGDSPLSPAAMIGVGTPSQHENLFLPRSNSFYENTSNRNQNESAGDIAMGPPVSRQPSNSDMQSTINGGFVWPPPGTMSSPSMSNITAIPTLPFSMMAPFLTNPLTLAHDPTMSNSSTLLPNLQPFIYNTTTNTMQQRHEPLSGSIPSSLSHSPQQSQSLPETEEESEEKRNKRLERNRESARKCRLKKKERLHTLGLQVTELHKRIEHERRAIINNMIPILMQHCRQHEIMNFMATTTIDDGSHLNHGYYNPLTEIIRGSGPSSTMMRSVLEFQYSALKDITLPHYQKLLLWFTTQKESYFTIGKEQYYIEQQKKIKQQQQEETPVNHDNSRGKEVSNQSTTTEASGTTSGHFSANIRPNAIKVSSKQIGEELMTGNCSSSINDDALPKKRQNKSSQVATGGSTNAGISSSAVHDGAKSWPLFCYELKLSVDQEERFVGKHKQIAFEHDRQSTAQTNATSSHRSLSYIREEMAVAVTTTENLGKAVGTLSHMIAQRDECTYLNILHPQQVAKYYSWLSQHRPMVRQVMQCNSDAPMEDGTMEQAPTLQSTIDKSAPPGCATTTLSTSEFNGTGDSASLHTISRRLSEVLQISSRQQMDKVDCNSMNQNT